MKKLYVALISLIMSVFILGCDNLTNNPTKKVEEFLNKYQVLDNAVLNDLDKAINNETMLNGAQKTIYKDIIKKQYQNLTYKIIDQEINGNEATVKAEITVADNSKVLEEVEEYKQNNEHLFINEMGEYDEMKYMDYRLEQLKDSKEKIKYTIVFHVSKIDEKWQLNSLSNSDLDKINGIYTR